jgi:hypothetical protein
MKQLFLGLCFLLIGCGEHFCEGFSVYGMCVETGSFDINVDMVSLSAVTTEFYMDRFGRKVDLETAAWNYNLVIQYISFNEIGCDECLGLYQPGNYYIEIGAKNLSPTSTRVDRHRECLMRYYNLSHELLHFISIEVFEDSVELNEEHMVPHTFRDWCAEAPNVDASECIEYQTYLPITNKCGEEIGNGGE